MRAALALHGGEERIPDHLSGDAAVFEHGAAIGGRKARVHDVLDPPQGVHYFARTERKRVNAAAAFLCIAHCIGARSGFIYNSVFVKNDHQPLFNKA